MSTYLPWLLRSTREGAQGGATPAIQEDAGGLTQIMQVPCLGTLLVFHINQVIQPLFSTNFPTTLFFPNLFIFLIKQSFPRLRLHPCFEFPGSTGAGPQQVNISPYLFLPFLVTLSPRISMDLEQEGEPSCSLTHHIIQKFPIDSSS